VVLIRRWWPALLLVVLGAGGGGAAALVQAPVYTAEARLVVGESSLSANMIPGFALATQEIASNYSRFVTKGPVLQELPRSSARLVKTVSASPIPGSNIVRIEATATSAAAARLAASDASANLIRQVAALSPQRSAANTLQRLGKLSRDMTATQALVAETQARVSRLRDSTEPESAAMTGALEALAKGNARLSTLQAQQNALNSLYLSQVGGPPQSSLQLVNPARVVGDDIMSRLQLYVLGGAGLGCMVGLLLIRRRDRHAAAAPRPSAPDPAAREVFSQPHTLHLDPGRAVPVQMSHQPPVTRRHSSSSGDRSQLLDPIRLQEEWGTTSTSGRRRATGNGDGGTARLRR
jgi:hypothetical protein